MSDLCPCHWSGCGCDTPRERDDFLLNQAQPHVCSMLCPSTRKGDEPWVHHGLCEAITERLRGVDGGPLAQLQADKTDALSPAPPASSPPEPPPSRGSGPIVNGGPGYYDAPKTWAKGVASSPPERSEGWQPIETAPKDGTRVDLCAKAWLPAFDRFESRRFPDCVWMKGDPMCNRSPYWLNLDKDWYPTHWIPLPALPPEPSNG
jgi:hypothetical protein